MSYQQTFKAFKLSLEELQLAGSQANPDAPSLQSHFLEVQQTFQRQILTFADTTLEAVEQSRIQAYCTEMNKQMRLLGMDIVFLQAARQPVTVQGRQAQIRDRIKRLIDYCKAVLGEA
ncbi:MAG: heterocyst frequency control protein PatD [Leptolyngbyaceae cyanobacterium MO_188.B28]|nr:heterocyst frequency control protein PatD [Leptolyngbyaceae cyanobacterium MO_188.B28]